jgi:membrane protease YdiL (CAAX protease family)
MTVVDGLSRSLSTLKDEEASKNRLQKERAALIIAAAEMGERPALATKDWRAPRRVREAYPELWGEYENSFGRDPLDLCAWLVAILDYRTHSDAGDASTIRQLERATLYLNFITSARLSAWLLAAVSLVFLFASSTDMTRPGNYTSASMLYAGIQALCFFTVGDEIVQWSVSRASGWTTYWFWLLTRALLFAAVIVWACRRVGVPRLLAGPRALPVLGWSAVALGLILVLQEASSVLLGEVSPLVYLRPQATALGPELLIVAAFSFLLTPVLEELIFRELLFSGLQAQLGSRLAIAISALSFAAIHVGTVDHVLFALFVGIALAVVRSRSGSLLPCVVCHSTVNTWWWFRDFILASIG